VEETLNRDSLQTNTDIEMNFIKKLFLVFWILIVSACYFKLFFIPHVLEFLKR